MPVTFLKGVSGGMETKGGVEEKGVKGERDGEERLRTDSGGIKTAERRGSVRSECI